MSRYIDADAVRAYIYRPYSHEESYSNIDIEGIIRTAPSIDIVRCKECKHRYVSGHTTQYYICDFLDAQNKDDGFCSYGERRE